MSVGKNERDLLVVSYLFTGGNQQLPWLYRWLEDNAVDLARVMLSSHYRKFATLEGDEVTSANFIDRITSLASDNQLQALDVFLHLHGLPEKLVFKDGAMPISKISEKLQAANLKKKLRVLFSTACYGKTHATGFIQAGFRVVSGAEDVNANAVIEYPVFMDAWRDEKTFKSAVYRAPNALTVAQDNLAKLILGDTLGAINSFKQIMGRSYTRITTLAD
jgi:hypothetical protein